MKVSRKKADPAQTQLQLDFESARTALQGAVDNYVGAAIAAATCPVSAKAVKKAAKSDASALRAQVNKMACRVAGQSGRDHRDVWILAYHLLFKRTGFHAVAEAANSKIEDRLGLVEKKGFLGTLMEVFADMIVAPGFAPATDPLS